jgi:hypothetical protein
MDMGLRHRRLAGFDHGGLYGGFRGSHLWNSVIVCLRHWSLARFLYGRINLLHGVVSFFWFGVGE